MGSGFNTGSSVYGTDQITVLNAIVDKLRTDISDAFGGESTCFVSDTPWPGVEVQDELFCTVHPLDSQFQFDDPVGGGSEGIVENAVFGVTVWSKIILDRLEHNATELTDADRGLLTLKKRVLKCRAGQQIHSDYPMNTTPLLTAHLRPLSALHPPSRQGAGDFASFSIQFMGPFYWNLRDA